MKVKFCSGNSGRFSQKIPASFDIDLQFYVIHNDNHNWHRTQRENYSPQTFSPGDPLDGISTTTIYSYFLEHNLRPAVRRKRPNVLNSHPIVLHDGVRSHIAAPVVILLRRWNWEILEHPPYFPDMNPCDFDLFAKMKLLLRGVRFRIRQTIIAAVEQSVRRLVQQDYVDSMICGGEFFMVAVNILNKQSRRADEGWSSSLRVGRRLTSQHRKKQLATKPSNKQRRRWEDNIKMDLREVGYDDRDWINLPQDRDQWRAYVSAAMNLRVP
ncbi:hypothetical protein ANN_23538 [Periplaneta americana]|uniref:Transposase n=1 Tax=Periplaneta americana TaxID=6978 RepID=A0ABQ8SLD6_PERAM|nr:hypothetical protein ANN_23538 [Periplaneta americana]